MGVVIIIQKPDEVTKMIYLAVALLVVLSSIVDHSVDAQCYTDSGELNVQW